MRGIYTDIDTLFDTRLCLLYLINPELATELVKSGKYFERLKDNMGNMSWDIFKSFYKKRNKKLLELAIETNVLSKFIRPDCYEKVTHSSNGNGGFIKVYVNTYPYMLNNNEKDILTKLVNSKLYGGDVEMIYKHPKEVKPEWVYEKVASMFMYDGLHWLNYHSSTGDICRHSLPSVMLMVPTIIENSIPSHLITKTYLMSIEEATKNYIMLTFADTIYFCAKNIKMEDKNKE